MVTELISKRIMDKEFLKNVAFENKCKMLLDICRVDYIANIAASMLLKPAQFERFVSL